MPANRVKPKSLSILITQAYGGFMHGLEYRNLSKHLIDNIDNAFPMYRISSMRNTINALVERAVGKTSI